MDAVSETLAALPAGRVLSMATRVPGIRQLVAAILSGLEARREQLSRRLGLVPLAALDASEPGPSPARIWLRKPTAWLRDLGVAVMMVAVTSQILMENKIVPKVLKRGQKQWMIDMIVYPRLFQGWSMFTPDAPTGERMLYIDAITFDGRHVDPFNQAGSRVSNLPVDKIPPHMLQDEFWCDYTNRVPDNSVNWLPLKEWIFKYPTRTGRPEDRIVSYEARIIESDSPPPGQTDVRNIRQRVMTREHE
jgi:hypothetical protein